MSENEKNTVEVEVVDSEKKENKCCFSSKKARAIRSLLVSTFSLIVVGAYILLGVLVAWHPTWLIFLAIPLFGSAIEAVLRRNPQFFSVEILATGVFLLVGFLTNIWHPTWVILLSIPIYRQLISSYKKIKNIKDDD